MFKTSRVHQSLARLISILTKILTIRSKKSWRCYHLKKLLWYNHDGFSMQNLSGLGQDNPSCDNRVGCLNTRWHSKKLNSKPITSDITFPSLSRATYIRHTFVQGSALTRPKRMEMTRCEPWTSSADSSDDQHQSNWKETLNCANPSFAISITS
jgi:hypothetical protein